MKITAYLTSIAATALGAHSLTIAIYADDNCSTSIGEFEFSDGFCQKSRAGNFSSIEIYSPPEDGSLMFSSFPDCSGGVSGTSGMYLGCFPVGFEAQSAQYFKA